MHLQDCFFILGLSLVHVYKLYLYWFGSARGNGLLQGNYQGKMLALSYTSNIWKALKVTTVVTQATYM